MKRRHGLNSAKYRNLSLIVYFQFQWRCDSKSSKLCKKFELGINQSECLVFLQTQVRFYTNTCSRKNGYERFSYAIVYDTAKWFASSKDKTINVYYYILWTILNGLYIMWSYPYKINLSFLWPMTIQIYIDSPKR